MSDSENEQIHQEEEEEKKETKTIPLLTVLSRIFQSNLPLSCHPGYMMGFAKFLEDQDLSSEVENFLPCLTKVAKMLYLRTGKNLKKEPYEFIESSKNQMGIWYEMCFDLSLIKSMKTFLDVFKEMSITEEDCCRYAEKNLMSTSSMTAHTQMDHADARGTKRQRPTEWNIDEIKEDTDEIVVDLKGLPIFEIFSSIMAHKGEKQFIKRSRDDLKEFQARIAVYRKKDLLDCEVQRDIWKYKFQELIINYDSTDSIAQLMNQLKGAHNRYFETQKKDVKWAIQKSYR
uniref:NS2 n=1 Tax=uncultured densovirus TaxID=748192 RepID=A0A7L7YTT8_9VIRU|nr:NS2 [uncultured densovirus]